MEVYPDRGSEGWAEVETGMAWVTQEICEKRKIGEDTRSFYHGTPQSFNGRWRAKDDDGGQFIKMSGGHCQYRDTIIGIAEGLLGRDVHYPGRIARKMMVEAGCSEKDAIQDWSGRLIS